MNSLSTNLPPLTALRALEALDRLGSATAVARELNLTQSAVSRQIRTAEDILGTALTLRDGRRLRLTPAAQDFAAVIRAALAQLSAGALNLRMVPQGGSLNLAILPSFGMRWLVPRLPDFATRHPEVTLNMTTRLRPFAFEAETFDAALHFAGPAWPGTEALRLMTEYVLPVCAPDLLPAGPVAPQALARLPLLHIQTRPDAWARWFARLDCRTGPLPGTSFDQFTAIIQAALHGLGVALIPDYLVRTELATGALVRASDVPRLSLGAYDLVWPKDRPMPPALGLFRDWMASQAEGEDGLPR